MSRRATPALALALAVPALALPAGATSAAPNAPPLAAALSSCTVDADGSRSASFTASMPGGPRGGRLAMRLLLLERTPPERDPRRVGAAPEGWVTSRQGAGGLVHERRVKALRPPAEYRMEVRYRWYDAAGAVVRTARRHSPACRPPREP